MKVGDVYSYGFNRTKPINHALIVSAKDNSAIVIPITYDKTFTNKFSLEFISNVGKCFAILELQQTVNIDDLGRHTDTITMEELSKVYNRIA